jgi:hypothetical protein
LDKESSEFLPNGGVGESVLEFAASFAKQEWEIGSIDESKGGAQDLFQGGEGVGGWAT